MKKNICIITSVHPAFDDRIFYKEAKSLAYAGYDVMLIAQHNDNEVVSGIKIIPLPKPKNRFERFTKVIWKSLVLSLKEKANIYHIHDPELIPIGIILKLFAHRNVIYDLHELVYLDIEDKEWLRPKFFKRVIQLFYLCIERLSLILFDQLILARDDTAEHMKQMHRGYDNYLILKNFPILSLIKDAKPNPSLKSQRPIIFYAGVLSRDRGIKELIQSMEFIRNNALLRLLGKWESEEFKRECISLRGWIYAEYLGYVPFDKVYDYMKQSSIGISLAYPLKNYTTNLPIKAFEYMACSLPMVMSDFPYWRKMFGEFALFANPYDPKDIAKKVFSLLDNTGKKNELGFKGRQLIETKYNWETESKKLIGLYKKLLK